MANIDLDLTVRKGSFGCHGVKMARIVDIQGT